MFAISPVLTRRAVLIGGAALATMAETPIASPALRLEAKAPAAWFDAFYARALQAGLPAAVLDQELRGLEPEGRILDLDSRQPEFAEPVSVYVRKATGPGRIAEGRSWLNALVQFPEIEARFGVPREILIGIWAMESGYGRIQGDHDVLGALAALAVAGRRRDWAEGEMIATLKIIAEGKASRSRLRGSWAGAMGQTQVLPSVYLAQGVRTEGAGAPDVWTSAADALATAANLLGTAGWRRGEDWAREVRLPPGFDYGLSEGPNQPPAWWEEKGARRIDGGAWSLEDHLSTARLLLPCGWRGPAFLAFPNHFVIRAYNNALAYALSVGLLADAYAGVALPMDWPEETPMSLADRTAAQSILARKGFDPGPIDGVMGVKARQALRLWQKSVGLPADGYLAPEVLARLQTS